MKLQPNVLEWQQSRKCDGERTRCLVMFRPGDKGKVNQFILQGDKDVEQNLLNSMAEWTKSFGEQFDAGRCNGPCDNGLHNSRGRGQ
jgi:superfamily II DNA helicase RecQ